MTNDDARISPHAARGPRHAAGLLALYVCISMTNLSCDTADQPDAVWGRGGREPGALVYPRAMAKAPDGTFYVIDRAARIQHFDTNYTLLGGWMMAEWSQGKPVGLTVDREGNLWIPDTHYHRVLVFTPDGREIRRFGKKGAGPGEFDLPTDVAFDDNGNIYVAEYGENNRIQVFDKDLNYLRGWGTIGSADGQMARPQSIVVVGDLLYVTDACNHRLSVYKTDGTFVQNFGQSGGGPGEYRFPYGLELDKDGHLIVTEFGNNRVQKIDRTTGQPLASWGSPGRLPGELSYPWASITDGDRIITADAGNNRLQVFRFGRSQ